MDDKAENQHHNHPSLLPNHHHHNTTTNTTTTTIKAKEESPRKQQQQEAINVVVGGTSSANASERLKRDEWSEGAVSTLLEAYEAKWVLRNRAKLKGQDWEDVAKYVSSRANSTKSPKTQTQCKNKIESMKKRYRSESATADASSSWPLYSRLDLLLRGTGPISSTLPPPQTPATATVAVAAPSSQSPHPSNNQALMLLEPPSLAASQAPHQQSPTPPPAAAPTPPPAAAAQNSHGSNGVDRLAKVDIQYEQFFILGS